MRISFKSLKDISHIAVYGWSGISTLCVSSRTSLLTVQSLPSWGISEEGEVKDAHPGRAGAVGMKDPHSSA